MIVCCPGGLGRGRGPKPLTPVPRKSGVKIHFEWFSMPYMDGSNQRFIWGATAGMLRNLYRFLAA